MKINNKRLFTAEIYYREHGAETKKVCSNEIMLKVKSMYVPIRHVHCLLSYLMIKAHASSFGTIKEHDGRYYSNTPDIDEHGNITTVKNIKPFRDGTGKTKLNELHDLQFENDLRDPCQRTGGMEMIG